MAQKNKTSSKVRAGKVAPGVAKKTTAKSTKPAAAKKAAHPAKATASKSVSKPALKVAAKPQPAAKAQKKVAAKAKADVADVKKKVAAPVKAAAPAAKPADKAAVKAIKPTVAAGKAAPQRAVAAALATPASEKISAPAATGKQQEKKPVGQRHGFKMNEYVVYPAHGVGRIIGIEEQEIAGHSLELFVITFEKEKLTLRVPTGKLESVGMRKLSEGDTVRKAMETLKGRARVKRTMWSRRAQEYVAKINSGSLISIAEVVRDLYRSEAQPEQSYSERQLYEDALDRMAREIAAVDKLDDRGAVQRITDVLSKSARGRRAASETEEEAEAA